MTRFSYFHCLKSRMKLSSVLSSFMLCIILEGTEGNGEQLPWTAAGSQNHQKIPLSSCSVGYGWLPTQMHTSATTLACLQYALNFSFHFCPALHSHPHPSGSFWSFMQTLCDGDWVFSLLRVTESRVISKQLRTTWKCLQLLNLQCHSAGHTI